MIKAELQHLNEIVLEILLVALSSFVKRRAKYISEQNLLFSNVHQSEVHRLYFGLIYPF